MARNVDPRRLLELETRINELNNELDELDDALEALDLSESSTDERIEIQRDIEEATMELVDLEDERASLEEDDDVIYDEDMFDDDY